MVGGGGRKAARRVGPGEREAEVLFLWGANIEADIEGGDLEARYKRAEGHAERVLPFWALVRTESFEGWGVRERSSLCLLVS